MVKYLILICAMLLPSSAVACSCYFDNLPLEESVSRSLNSASAVVLARAISVETSSHKGRGSVIDVTDFEVLEAWKGDLGETFQTRIDVACCMCGYQFTPLSSYLLYLDGPDADGYYSASTCSRTAPQTRASKDIVILNRLKEAEKSNEEVH